MPASRHFFLRAAVPLLLAIGLAWTPPVHAVEYFVNKTGGDANDGLTRETAFLTVAKGVETLKPGDTLTIGPGEYTESVSRKDLGDETADTTLRAEIPGTALLRGDVPAPRFEKVDGYRFVYAASFEGDPQAVIESDTLRSLDLKPNVNELEFDCGAFHYDKAQKRLYISPTDLQPAGTHHYTISVTPRSGLLLENPKRVVIDGLAATGFYQAKEVGHQFAIDGVWGISLSKPVNCTVRNVTAYLNAGGICLDQGRDALIEHCTAYGNHSVFQTSANIGRYRSEGGDLIQFCTSYRTPLFGIVVYPNLSGPLTMRDNLDWGDYAHFKGKGLGEHSIVERCIGIDGRNPRTIRQSLVFPYNHYAPGDSGEPESNIVLGADGNPDEEFAAPERMDYRLQATSRFRKSGPGGKDRGPYPYEANIFYVKPDGDDKADGLSLRGAWKTLPRAIARLKPGDTLYLEAGVYPGALRIDAKGREAEPIRVSARGGEAVVFDGEVTLPEASHLVFESIRFAGNVVVKGGGDVGFRNCTFQGKPVALQVSGSPRLSVEQSLFAGFSRAAVALKKAPGAFLRGNLYANSQGPALLLDEADSIRYADYNGYQDGARAWSVAGTVEPLSAVRHEMYSQVRAPEIRVEEKTARLLNAGAFASGGPLGKSLGPHSDLRQPVIRLAGPFVHSVGDTEVNLEWHSSIPSAVELAWGETPDCSNRKIIKGGNWSSYSLTGLSPGRKVWFRINRVIPNKDAALTEMEPLLPGGEPGQCTTLASAPAPSTYHVAMDGDDSHDGLAPERAWRTLAHAASRVLAGDTVLIGGGVYGETVRVRATGKKGSPITFKAAPGQQVFLDGCSRSLGEAFILSGKNDVHLDALYFRLFGYSSSSFDFFGQQKGLLVVNESDGVKITRCLSDGRGVGYNPPFLVAYGSADLALRNCVIANSYNGILLYQSPNATVENCVFFRNLIASIIVGNPEGQPVLIRRNLFTDNLSVKLGIKLIQASRPQWQEVRDNCFYLRLPAGQRKIFLSGSREGLTLAEYQAYAAGKAPGREADDSLEADPQFAGMQGFPVAEPKEGRLPYPVDDFMNVTGPTGAMPKELDFPALFALNPEVTRRGMGLDPAAFAGFPFHQEAAAR